MSIENNIVGTKVKLNKIVYTSDYAFAKGAILTVLEYMFHEAANFVELLLSDDQGNQLIVTNRSDYEELA